MSSDFGDIFDTPTTKPAPIASNSSPPDFRFTPKSNPEPVTQAHHVLPAHTPPSKLSKGAIAGIVVGSLIGFGVILFLIIYFTVIAKKNNGTSKYGTIQYFNQDSQVSGPFKPRDVISVKYLPSKTDAIAVTQFQVSVDNGVTYEDLATSKESTNTALWTIPETVFSSQCLFKVYDTVTPKDFFTSKTFTVIPKILLVSGPGTSKLDNVSLNSNVSVELDFDSLIPTLDLASDWIIEFSATEKFQAQFSGTVISVTPPMTTPPVKKTSTVTWLTATAPTTDTPVYWRLSTNTLKSAGYPQELSVQSNSPVNIVNTPPPPPGSMSIGIEDKKSGKGGYYTGGDPVIIVVLHSIDISGITFTYFDGATTQALVPTGPGVVVDANNTEFPWIIPANLFIDKPVFLVTATVGSKTASSTPGFVEPEFSWDQPATESNISVYVAGAPNPVVMRTNIIYNGSLDFSNWEVGFIDSDGKLNPCGTKTLGAVSVPIDWTVTQQQLGLDPTKSGEDTSFKTYDFYAKVSNAAGQSVTTTIKAVNFFGVWWVPTLSVLKNSLFTDTPYLTTSQIPPQQGNTFVCTADQSKAIQCYSVPITQDPFCTGYFIFIFPDNRQGPEDTTTIPHITNLSPPPGPSATLPTVAFGDADLFKDALSTTDYPQSGQKLPYTVQMVTFAGSRNTFFTLNGSRGLVYAPQDSTTNIQIWDWGSLLPQPGCGNLCC